ncbi:MAG: carbohydrate-binding domain-containing protein, partial [Candidatus Ancillula sp.]|nr:carbohydrate-binding domain-containing protein [Candidatus Ancillula sp.]
MYTINSDATADANLTISGTTTNKRVVVASGATATVTLNGASIDQGGKLDASGSVFSISAGASVTLKLQGNNTIKSGSNSDGRTGYAGLNVPENATLTIQSATGDGTGTEGSLTANGGAYSAGIGGGRYGNGENITINGGIVNATGGGDAAGIGCGHSGSGGTITINGGTVKATGGDGGAGIGSGRYGNGGNITINGGIVNATGESGAAGIGGGQYGTSGNITITGGTVIAKARNDAGSIGNSHGYSGGSTTIQGGTVIGIGGQIGMGNTDTTAITNHPIILAPGGIKGLTADDDSRANGILVGSDVSIDTSTTPITVTINADMTIPSGATFTVPSGVKVVVTNEKTLTIAGGGTIEIEGGGTVDVFGTLENNGTISIADDQCGVIEPGGSLIGSGIITGSGKFNGSDVSDLSTQSITSTSITINPVTLLSTTVQSIEYAINTSSTLPTSGWQTGTTFTSLNSGTTYYIFARSIGSTIHKAGTAKVLQVTTSPKQIMASIDFANEKLENGTVTDENAQ